MDYEGIVKYLGVYLDKGLLWKDHINIKLKKAKKRLFQIVKVCRATWGLPPSAVLYYYQCCIVPLLTWGCLVWARACRYKTVQNELKKFQRQALKIMGPIRRSTPTRGLEIMNYCRPLELEIRKISAEVFLRTRPTNKMPTEALKNNAKRPQSLG